MTKQDYQSIALQYCIGIYEEYTEEEIADHLILPVVQAWHLGKEYVAAECHNNLVDHYSNATTKGVTK